MQREDEAIEYLKQIFADGKPHASGELCELLCEKYGFTKTRTMRRVMSLYADEEIVKVRRGMFQQNTSENGKADEQLYKVFCDLHNVIAGYDMSKLEASDFSEPYRLAVCELITMSVKIKKVIERLEGHYE